MVISKISCSHNCINLFYSQIQKYDLQARFYIVRYASAQESLNKSNLQDNLQIAISQLPV